MENETAKQFGWLHSSIVVMLEDRSPASAVRMLLRGCEVAGELGEARAAEALLSAALAVYERCATFLIAALEFCSYICPERRSVQFIADAREGCWGGVRGVAENMIV